MRPLGLKEWFLYSIPPLLMGIGIGLGFGGNPGSFYIFSTGVVSEIPTLWLVYKHK